MMTLFKKALKKILILAPVFISFISVNTNVNASTNTSLTIDTWIEDTSAPGFIKRSRFTTEVVNGKIYCIGGQQGYDVALDIVQEYDPETNTWTTKSPMPTKRTNLASVVFDEKIYCIGGDDTTSSVSILEVYDPVADTWTTKSSMPKSKTELGAELIDGKIYCFGGSFMEEGGGVGSQETFEYNIATDKWVSKQSLPYSRGEVKTASIDGKLYSLKSGTLVNYLDRYDPTADTWEMEISRPTGREYFGLEVVDDVIYCFGGQGMLGYLKTVQSYDYLTNKWTNKASLPFGYHPMLSAVVDGKIYSFGDYDNETGTMPLHIYITEKAVLLESRKAVLKAENTRLVEDIEYARSLVIQLSESVEKNELIDKLDAIEPVVVEKNSATSNIDVYINPQSILSLSLDTNNITFEDFNGVEDMEKKSAINLSVESSLPYEINASLEGEIQNADGTEIVDKSVLGIKISNKSDYDTFSSINTPLNLIDNQDLGRGANTHSIDLILRKDKIVKADAYRTTIRFEVKQK